MRVPAAFAISGTFSRPHRGQITPSGQRMPSSTSRHFESQLYLSIRVIRSMAQPPKKRRRSLPKDLRDRNDHDVMEHVFGKRGMRVIDAELEEEPDEEVDSESSMD